MNDPAQLLSKWAVELRDLRKQLGATQAQVAEMLGVSRSAVAHWERGNHPVPPQPLHRLRIIYAVHAASVRSLLAIERKQTERFKGLWNEARDLADARDAHIVELQAEVERLKEERASLRRERSTLTTTPTDCREWLINATCERVAEWQQGAAPPVSQMREALEVLRVAEGER